MTDRRRNLFVLLLIGGLLAASALAIVTKPTRLGLDLQGGVSLIYQAEPTKQAEVNSESIERAIDIMRKRVDQLGVAEPEIQRSGEDQIDVSLPDVENADEAAAARRHDGPALLLRLGGQRPGPGLPARSPERGGDRRAAGRQRGRCAQPLRRGQARRDVRAAGLRRRVDTPVLPRRRAGQARAGRPRGERGRGAAGRARAQPGGGSQRRGRGRAAGDDRRARRAGRRGRPPAGPLVRAARQARAERHRHQEPRAELRPGGRRHGGPERHLRVLRPRAGAVAADHARDRPARAGVVLRRRPVEPPTSTSRSCWTTS